MDEAKAPRIVARANFVVRSERDYFETCPVCGVEIDCRDLGQVLDHWHDGPMETVDFAVVGNQLDHCPGQKQGSRPPPILRRRRAYNVS